jgi:hypothetical protein
LAAVFFWGRKMDKHTFYSQICDAVGIDAVREHYGLAAGASIASEVGGLELIQKVWEAAKGILSQFGPVALDDSTIAAIKAAMNMALDKVFEIVDWPIVPDAPVDAVLRMLANRWFDAAVVKIKSGS